MIGFNIYHLLPASCIRLSWFLLLRRASSTLCLLHCLQLLLFLFRLFQFVRQYLAFILQRLKHFLFFCLFIRLLPRRWLWRRRGFAGGAARAGFGGAAARGSAAASVAPSAAATSAAASSSADDAVRLATAAFAAPPVRALACALPLMFWREL